MKVAHSDLERKVVKAVVEASFCLRKDVKKLLLKAYQKENQKSVKKVLGWILENSEIAKKENLAICQDTGLPIVFIEVGRSIKIDSGLIGTIAESIEYAYRRNYLRPSITDPLIRKPSYRGINCHIEFSNIKGLKLTIFPKGFGSENKSQLKMFNPTAPWDEIEEFITKSVEKAGPEACPPFIIGIGIGGTSDKALLLAKRALIERVDLANPDKLLNSLEKRLFRKINSLKIGPMGLGGKHTCLAVKIKKAPTHIAGLPVGVNISCHALRSASVLIR